MQKPTYHTDASVVFPSKLLPGFSGRSATICIAYANADQAYFEYLGDTDVGFAEMFAILRCLQMYGSQPITIISDSATSVALINKNGVTSNQELKGLMAQIWEIKGESEILWASRKNNVAGHFIDPFYKVRNFLKSRGIGRPPVSPDDPV